MRTRIINHAALRSPTVHEIDMISWRMEEESRKNVRLYSGLTIGLIVLGLIFGFYSFTQTDKGIYIMYGFLTLLCLIGCLFALKTKKDTMEQLKLYKHGLFCVISGRASSIVGANDLPGMSNIIFCADADETDIGLFRVENKDLTTESPLLLMFIPENVSITGKDVYRVFRV